MRWHTHLYQSWLARIINAALLASQTAKHPFTKKKKKQSTLWKTTVLPLSHVCFKPKWTGTFNLQPAEPLCSPSHPKWNRISSPCLSALQGLRQPLCWTVLLLLKLHNYNVIVRWLVAARSIVSNSLAGGLGVLALLSLSVPPELECPLMEQARSNHCSNWSLLWSFQSRRIFKDKGTMKHYLLSQAWCDLDLVASSIIDESLKHTFMPPFVTCLHIRFYLIQESRVWPR